MIGSQAPKMEVQSSTTPEENAPSGLLARGSYTVTSLFTDDYNTEHLKVSLLNVKHIKYLLILCVLYTYMGMGLGRRGGGPM